MVIPRDPPQRVPQRRSATSSGGGAPATALNWSAGRARSSCRLPASSRCLVRHDCSTLCEASRWDASRICWYTACSSRSSPAFAFSFFSAHCRLLRSNSSCSAACGAGARAVLEGQGPPRRPQRRLDRRLEEVAKAVGGGYCRLQMPLRPALGVMGTVAGHRLGALEVGWGLQCIAGRGCGGGMTPAVQCCPRPAAPPVPDAAPPPPGGGGAHRPLSPSGPRSPMAPGAQGGGGRCAPPLCDIPSGCCSFTGPWTVPRSSLRMLRRVAAFCRPLRPVLLLVSLPRSRSPVVGVPGLC